MTPDSAPTREEIERRDRDLNPGGYSPNGFQDRRIRPLCHPSKTLKVSGPADRSWSASHCDRRLPIAVTSQP